MLPSYECVCLEVTEYLVEFEILCRHLLLSRSQHTLRILLSTDVGRTRWFPRQRRYSRPMYVKLHFTTEITELASKTSSPTVFKPAICSTRNRAIYKVSVWFKGNFLRMSSVFYFQHLSICSRARVTAMPGAKRDKPNTFQLLRA